MWPEMAFHTQAALRSFCGHHCPAAWSDLERHGCAKRRAEGLRLLSQSVGLWVVGRTETQREEGAGTTKAAACAHTARALPTEQAMAQSCGMSSSKAQRRP